MYWNPGIMSGPLTYENEPESRPAIPGLTTSGPWRVSNDIDQLNKVADILTGNRSLVKSVG